MPTSRRPPGLKQARYSDEGPGQLRETVIADVLMFQAGQRADDLRRDGLQVLAAQVQYFHSARVFSR